ncbi:unnamed protein product, partial [Discosporangium mesarthrocarpum]
QQALLWAGEARRSREQLSALRSEVQALRCRPPEVVERVDPAAAAGRGGEAGRLRDRVCMLEEVGKEARRAAKDASEAVGRELAVNQGLQRDLDNARHRLLTMQGSLAESVVEVANRSQELESERLRAATASRRLQEAVDHHEEALKEVRGETRRLREQRDSFGQDCAVLGAKLRQLRRSHGVHRMVAVWHGLLRGELAKGMRA